MYRNDQFDEKYLMTKNFRKTLSRFAAIQTYFQVFFTKKSLNIIAKEFHNHNFNNFLNKKNKKPKYDLEYYKRLIIFINNFNLKNDANTYFSKYFKNKRPYLRLDTITKTILIVGSSELLQNSDLDDKIIINEYVEVSKSFLNKPEVSLINAILDNISKSKYEKKDKK